jgi:hypothetical protein
MKEPLSLEGGENILSLRVAVTTSGTSVGRER